MSSRQPDYVPQEDAHRTSKQHASHPSLPATMLASATASMLARVPCHPLDTAKAKLQVGWAGGGLRAVLWHTMRTEGVRGLYRGFGAAFLGSAPAGMCYFTVYELTKRALASSFSSSSSSRSDDEGPFVVHFAAGLMAEVVSCVFWVPIGTGGVDGWDVVKERLQVQSTLSSKHAYKGSLDALFTIVRTEGIGGLYRGYGATVVSFGPWSALYFVFYEQLKGLAERFAQQPTDRSTRPTLSFSTVLACAATAGSMAALVTNVIDMAKLRIQVERAGGAHAKKFGYANVFQGVKRIVADEGVRGVFRGAGARIAFQAPTTAIALAAYEKLKVWFACIV